MNPNPVNPNPVNPNPVNPNPVNPNPVNHQVLLAIRELELRFPLRGAVTSMVRGGRNLTAR